ncbi:MAG: ABC transporter substrate-binding protein, partial [Duodenibacillus sp.]|nr:ABC transporter substrate-binding protein [Duodenibacillus sp.]
MKKRTLLALAAAACAGFGLAGTSAAAPAYPAHEVKLVIPFAPGGATDVVFRVVSERA